MNAQPHTADVGNLLLDLQIMEKQSRCEIMLWEMSRLLFLSELCSYLLEEKLAKL